MKITLCDKVLVGDIPTYDFKDQEEALTFIYSWLSTKDFDKSVFVCFATFDGLENKDLRNEQNAILVSHCWDNITDMLGAYIDVVNYHNVNFSVFEFEDYQEAFGYCTDLKESF
jgi:hypothetical protein